MRAALRRAARSACKRIDYAAGFLARSARPQLWYVCRLGTCSERSFRLFSVGDIVAERYRVLGELGRGGMGAVYDAEHLSLGSRVALKVLLPNNFSSSETLNRFLNEARAAARIEHPGVVRVFDLGAHNGTAFIAMERLAGRELEDVISDGPLRVETAVEIGEQIAEAVQAAHDCGIIHRDLKPANVIVETSRGRPRIKILDFGIAKIHGEASGGVETKTGAVFGTPQFMAPEQFWDAKSVDARADVYAIGGILYSMLSGRVPFDADSINELIAHVAATPPPPIAEVRENVPVWLEQLVQCCLAKKREDRPPSADAVLKQLEARTSDAAPPSSVAFDKTAMEPLQRNSEAPASTLTTTIKPVRRGRFAAGVVVGVVAVAAAATVIGLRSSRPSPEQVEATAVPTAAVDVTPAASARDQPEVQPIAPVPEPAPSASVADKPRRQPSSRPKRTKAAQRPTPPAATADKPPELVPR